MEEGSDPDLLTLCHFRKGNPKIIISMFTSHSTRRRKTTNIFIQMKRGENCIMNIISNMRKGISKSQSKMPRVLIKNIRDGGIKIFKMRRREANLINNIVPKPVVKPKAEIGMRMNNPLTSILQINIAALNRGSNGRNER